MYRLRSSCRLCEHQLLEKVFSLTPTPPANAFIPASKLNEKQECFPLDMHFCPNCYHLQLVNIVSPEELFSEYVYVSGTSPVFVNHFKEYANKLVEEYKLSCDSFVLDIGSNDGTLLSFFKEKRIKTLGVEPARDIALKCQQGGQEVINDFFNRSVADVVKSDFGVADIVTANNVFAHIDELGAFLESVKYLIEDKGVFCFEVSYLGDVYEKCLFDTIYHEHLSYHSVVSLDKFMSRHKMRLVNVEHVDTHGGSIRCRAVSESSPISQDDSVQSFINKELLMGFDKRETYINYMRKINQAKETLVNLLTELKSQNKKIAAFGAPAKATTLMYHFGLDNSFIEFIVDDSPLKQNMYSPGLHIPVLPSSEIYNREVDEVVILAWNFADPIMKNHKQYIENGGHFIVPLPEVVRI